MAHTSLTASLRETLALFESGVPLTTTEVAERLDLGRRSTYDRLDRLVEAGHLDTKKVGANARVWWRPEAPGANGGGDTSEDSLLREVLEGAEVGVFVLDDSFEVAWCNETVEQYFGIDATAALGTDKRTLVEENIAPIVEDSTTFAETVLATYEDNSYNEQFECHITAGEGREGRWVEHQSRPIESGTYEGGCVELYYDVTDRKRSEQEYETQREQFESLVSAVEEYAIFMLDAEGHVQTWNAGAERIKGYEADDILGEHFSTFYTDEACEAGVPEDNLAKAADAGSVEDEGWRVRKDGSRFWANVTITAIRDDDGDLVGYMKVTRDMTDRREYEKRLRQERDFTQQILETAPASIFVIDADGDVVQANDRLRKQLGIDDLEDNLSVGDLDLYDENGQLVPPEERPYRTVFETGDPIFEWEGEVDLPSGDRRWVTINVAPILDDDGTVGRAVVSAQDITHLKQKEQQLQRQRDDLEAELTEVFDRVDDAFFALDENWRFVHVNEQAERVLDRSAGELLGKSIWDAFPEARGSRFQEEYERALESQESVTFEEYYPPLETWFEVNVYPSESGLSVYFRDVTDRKERERELERYASVAQTASDVIVTIDSNSQILSVNPAVEDVLGYDPDELEGESLTRLMPDRLTTAHFDAIAQYLETGERNINWEYVELPGVRADGTEIPLSISFSEYQYGGEHYFTGIIRDISDQKERERELAYRTALLEAQAETTVNGLLVVDDDRNVLYYNERFLELWDIPETVAETRSDEELLEAVDDMLANPEEFREKVEYLYDHPEEEIYDTIQLADGRWLDRYSAPVVDNDTYYGRLWVFQDITERLEREQELEQRVHQQEVVTTFGQRALEDRDLDALMADAAELVADTLDTDYCKVLELDQDSDELLVRQGVGWDEGVVGSATVSAADDDSRAAYTLRSEQPVVVSDLDSESRFSGPDLLTSHDVKSGISTVIGPLDDPWGILGVHDTTVREFSDHDVNFLQSIANILAPAIARHEDEQELLRQREQLAALNNVNSVVREITEAVIEQSTRSEIEETVCEYLTDSESYVLAWIGDVDANSHEVQVRTEHGVDGYLDDITITVNPDDERSEGPTGQAFKTGEMQVAQDIRAEEQHDPWREKIEKYGFRSSAAIPITYEDTVYGVINVYASRTHAFEGQERVVLEQLGEIVGHAIAATERKQALMNDELVELEFQIPNVFDAIGVDADVDGTITLDHALPIRDNEYLVYGTTSEDATDTVQAIVDAVPHWEEVTFREGGQFELRLSEPPVLSAVAANGGYVESAIFEDGDYRMTIHLSPTVDARQLIDVVQEAYPQAQLIRRQQITREEQSTTQIRRMLATELTERQRTVLEAAYHAGFFEWPRDVSGQDVAEMLDVAAPTFHQHLRKAERKVFDHFLSTSPPNPSEP